MTGAESNPITTDTFVADALARVPTALSLFATHGVDPTCDCGLSTSAVTLASAERTCGLRDAEGLAAELNDAIIALDAAEAWPVEGDEGDPGSAGAEAAG